MYHTRCLIAAIVLPFAASPIAFAQPTLPADFDAPGQTLDRIFTVGGVVGFTVSESTQSVFQGGSLQVDIGFNNGGFFSFQSVGLGAQSVSGANFNIQPGADTFSITILAPSPAVGGLQLFVTLRDDDNHDAIINLADDDEWISDPVPIAPGLGVYNIPLAAFTDANPGEGDDTPNIGSGLAGTMILTLETRESLPAGRITQPITVFLDHGGVFADDQNLPNAGPCNIADFAEPLGVLDFSDVLAFLTAFGSQNPAADLAPPTGVFDFTDVIAFLGAFGAGCP